MTKFLIATAATLTAAILPSAASAQQAPQTQSVQISYSDLDLRTSAGRQALDGRLRSATNRLCRDGMQSGVTISFERQRCLREARASAQSGARIAVARAHGGDNAVLASR